MTKEESLEILKKAKQYFEKVSKNPIQKEKLRKKVDEYMEELNNEQKRGIRQSNNSKKLAK